MKPAILFLFALVSSLLLPACSARSSLTTPTECGFSLQQGRPGESHNAGWQIALLDDGSAVFPVYEHVDSSTYVGTYRIRKVDAEGQPAWDLIGEEGGPSPWIVTRDGAGAILVAGTLRFGARPSLGSTITCPEVGLCLVVAKVSAAGVLQWSKLVVPTKGQVIPQDIAVSESGRITVIGSFQGTIDFGCGPMATTDTWSSHHFLAQLSPSGECIWSRPIYRVPGKSPTGTELAVGDDGEVVMAMGLPMDFSPQSIDLGSGEAAFDTSKGQGIALAKYAPNGDVEFTKIFTGDNGKPTYPISAYSIDVALTATGEVLLSTGYDGVLDLGAGPKGAKGTIRHFVAKLDAKGQEVWTRDISVESGSHIAFARAADSGFFLAGGGRPGMKIMDVATPESVLFVAEYDASGEPLDVQTFPITGEVHVSALETNAGGALVVAGSFAGTIDFGRSTLQSAGTLDAFVAGICR